MARTLAGVAARAWWFGLLFTVAAVLGRLTIMEEGTSLSLVWPAAGVAVVWFAVARRGGWWWLFDATVLAAVTVVVNVVTGASLPLAGTLVVSNLAQVLTFLGVLGWLHRRRRPLSGGWLRTLSDLWSFAGAAVVSSLVGAALGPTAVWLLEGAWTWQGTVLWMTRNMTGILLVGSLGLLLVDRVADAGSPGLWARSVRSAVVAWLRAAHVARVGELLTLLVASAVVYVVGFQANHGLPLAFPLLTVTVWAALRFDTLVVAVHGLLAGSAAVVSTVLGLGPFAEIGSEAVRGLVAQAFVAMVAVVGLVLALGRDERASLHQQLAEAERAASAQARLMSALVNSMSDGLVVVDEHGHVVLHNPAATALLGVSAGSARRADELGLFDLDGAPLRDHDLPSARILRGEDVAGEDMVMRNPAVPDGRILNTSATALPADEPGAARSAVVVFHDVTADRRHRDELASFAGVVAHDLLNPLATIDGWAQVLADTLQESSDSELLVDADASLDRIRRAAARMRNLINDLLAYTTARDADLAAIDLDLNDLVADIITARTDHAATDTTSMPSFDVGTLHTVHTDPVLTRQLLDNLIGNAIKYTAPGLTPQLRITTSTTPEGMVRIDITDNGIGIPAGQHAAIFDNFHRAHRDHGYTGTGLGLAICKRIVERHGGTISAAANPHGPGTRLTATLPQATPAAKSACQDSRAPALT
jgi:signal transduction histidine kinase